MKKVVYGFILISVFGLTACGNDKKETTSSSKVEQLESRVKELESSSSVEEPKQDKEKILSSLTSDINKKIVEAFLDNDLKIDYPENMDSLEYFPNEYDIENSPTKFISKMSFNTGNLIGVDSIGIETYESSEDLMNAEKNLQDESSADLYMSTNTKILSLMYTYKPNDSKEKEQMDQEFNKYKEVFEKIE
ncbi:hypothetical protein [Enterococcus sp. UD-01]|jgi:outer membrane murein-binding lipoprotein Lpp|uniref:hypothetical protein n=1 Tax=Enterococcus sp. UD-01 TaxID=3373911 RepID=UPI003838AEAD